MELFEGCRRIGQNWVENGLFRGIEMRLFFKDSLVFSVSGFFPPK